MHTSLARNVSSDWACIKRPSVLARTLTTQEEAVKQCFDTLSPLCFTMCVFVDSHALAVPSLRLPCSMRQHGSAAPPLQPAPPSSQGLWDKREGRRRAAGTVRATTSRASPRSSWPSAAPATARCCTARVATTPSCRGWPPPSTTKTPRFDPLQSTATL